MGLNLKQFEKYVLEPTLCLFDPEIRYSQNAYNLVKETIVHESGGLTYLAQYPYGPARGLGQIERPTFDWLTREWLLRIGNERIWNKFKALCPTWPAIQFEEVTWNLRLAVALVRCRYLPDPQPIPDTVEERAVYWGRVYQTTSDPVKIQQYIDHARQMA